MAQRAALADLAPFEKTLKKLQDKKIMSRSFKNFLFFLIPFILTLCSGLAFAVDPIFSRVPLAGYVPSVQGPFYVNPNAFPSSSSHAALVPFDIQTTRGPVSANIPVTVNANVSRVGKAVATFAKRVGPVGTGLAVADLICDLSGICSQSGSWSTAPTSYPGTFQPSCQTGSASTACIDMGPYAGGTGMEATCSGFTSGAVLSVANVSGAWLAICRLPLGYTPSSGGTPTDDDWYAAETVLSSAQFISHLAASGEPVPVDAPIISPVTVPVYSSDVVNKDASGNPVSTTTTSTVQEIIPAPLADDPLRVQTQEQVTVTTKDASGVVLSSSTTNITQAPIAPLKFPDDYNREVTQKSVETTLKHLDNSEGKTLPVHDPSAVGSQVSAETQKTVDQINELKGGSTHDTMAALFNFFVWSPPSVPCVNPNLNFKGFTFSPDICTPAGYLQQALSFFFALFGAWTIYGIIFRK